MKYVYLFRHGKSEANDAGLVTGDLDDPLTYEGLIQVRNAADMLFRYGLQFEICFVSHWRRAHESAVSILSETEFVVDSRLGETDAGRVANWPLTHFNGCYPEFWSNFDADRRYPEGESHNELYLRVVAWFDSVQSLVTEGSSVLAVTHAGPISCLIQHICGIGMHGFPLFIPDNASLTRLDRKPNGTWRLGFFSLTSPILVPCNNYSFV